MKKIFLVFFLVLGTSSAVLFAQLDPAKLLYGMTVEGRAVNDQLRTFVFSKDGKTAILKEYKDLKYTLVKQINGTLVYEATFDGITHYACFKLMDAKSILVAGPSSAGDMKKNQKDYTSPDYVAQNIDKLGVIYTIRKK